MSVSVCSRKLLTCIIRFNVVFCKMAGRMLTANADFPADILNYSVNLFPCLETGQQNCEDYEALGDPQLGIVETQLLTLGN